MGRVGIICLNTPGHLISMVALAGATPPVATKSLSSSWATLPHLLQLLV